MHALKPVLSPVFPVEKDLEIPKDATPLTKSHTVQIFLQLAEPTIFVQGFSSSQWEGRPPAILRGSLIVRILKPTKLKSINLTFKGVSRTEWPEGIPPKKQEFVESFDVVNHTWPFYQSDLHLVSNNLSTEASDLLKGSNAALYRPLSAYSEKTNSIKPTNSVRSLSPIGNFLKSSTVDIGSVRSVRSVSGTFSDILSITQSNNSDANSMRSSGSANGPATESFIFQPGDYIYSFEHPITMSIPETINATFGQVQYFLLVNIERQGAFKSDLNVRYPINIVRTPADSSVEETEPIAISRDWNSHLHYDIVIASKDIVLDAFLPIAFRVVPLDKVSLHRIRIYLTETMEYFCKGKKVHRLETTRKYLLTEHRAPPLKDIPDDAVATKAKYLGNLLEDEYGDLVSREFEYQVFIPEKLNFQKKIHPDTSYNIIKSNHWIKISLRLSKMIDGQKKHYEISIDSPIHVLNKLSSHANTLLPSYDTHSLIPGGNFDAGNSDHNIYHDSNLYFPRQIINSPIISPDVQPLDEKFSVPPRSLSPLSIGKSNNILPFRHLPSNENIYADMERNSNVLESPELSSNLYRPEHLVAELASAQAIPLSPMVSPITLLHQFTRKPSVDPPSFDEGELFQGSNSNAYNNSSLPKDPPTYSEVLTKEGINLDSDSRLQGRPDIFLTTDDKQQSSHDITEGFYFNGSDTASMNLPTAVVKSQSVDERLPGAVKSSLSLPGRTSGGVAVSDILPSNLKNSSASYNDLENILSNASNLNVEVPDRVSPHSSCETVQNLCTDMLADNSIANVPLLRKSTTNDDQESKTSVDITAMLDRDVNTWHPFQDHNLISPILSQSYSLNIAQSNHALEDFKNNIENHENSEASAIPNMPVGEGLLNTEAI